MAPEIKEGKTHDGKQIDMFPAGVILFSIVQGIIPFKEAKKDEYFYNLMLKDGDGVNELELTLLGRDGSEVQIDELFAGKRPLLDQKVLLIPLPVKPKMACQDLKSYNPNRPMIRSETIRLPLDNFRSSILNFALHSARLLIVAHQL